MSDRATLLALAERLKRCGRGGCSPGHVKREGPDHNGIDIFVMCNLCSCRGPYMECYESTPELKAKVAAAWKAHLLAGTEQGEGE